MKIWYDITNTPQVHFLLAVESMLKESGIETASVYTAREFSETAKLLEKRVGNGNYVMIGGHYGKSYIKKSLGLLNRFTQVLKQPFTYDVSISCGSESAIWSAWFKHRPSIAFGDNDQARQWTYAPFVSKAFFPDAIDSKVLEKQGLKGKLYQYHGYKEDLYLAQYAPNADFIKQLPFNHYVVVRPENVMANYIRDNSVKSITPELLKLLSQQGYNILYLPRYEMDRQFANGILNLYVPEEPINGLDACYFADAVLTGAGTFAREAACLGVPSFSFFAGKERLAVDKQMIANGQMYFSRDANDLMRHLHSSKKTIPNLHRCQQTRDEVLWQLKDFFSNM